MRNTVDVWEISSAEGEPGGRQSLSTSVTAPSEALQSWSINLVERSLLSCRRRDAVSAEDYAAALQVQKLETVLKGRLAQAQEDYQKSQRTGDAQALEVLIARKKKAIVDEDYELAE
eukprot:6228373-Amphidinium_carterae.1